MKISLPVSLIFSFSLLLGFNSANATIVQSALAPNKIGISVSQLMATTSSNVSLPIAGNRPAEMANASKGIHLGTNTDIFQTGIGAYWLRYSLDDSSSGNSSDQVWLSLSANNVSIGNSQELFFYADRISLYNNTSPTQVFNDMVGHPFACESGVGDCIFTSQLNLSFISIGRNNIGQYTFFTSATGFDVLFSEYSHEGGDSISGQYNLAPVPVPAAAWLMGSGLIGLVGIARRRK